MKILLVEDEPDLGTLIEKNLTHHQYIVDRAVDGLTAWNYFTHPQSGASHFLFRRSENNVKALQNIGVDS
jgi:CheY-like chemotaxis protein